MYFKKEEMESNFSGEKPESIVLKTLLCKDILSPKARSEKQLHLGTASTLNLSFYVQKKEIKPTSKTPEQQFHSAKKRRVLFSISVELKHL